MGVDATGRMEGRGGEEREDATVRKVEVAGG